MTLVSVLHQFCKIITIFLKCKILSLGTILSAYTHTHTQAFLLYKANYTQLKTGGKHPGRLGIDKDAWNRKYGRSPILGKELFLD